MEIIILYCVFSYLFVAGILINTLSESDLIEELTGEKISYVGAFVAWIFSPVLFPVILGFIYSEQ